MRTRKITDSEKAKHPNMDYVIERSRGKEYFTEAAFFELFNEIADVVSKNDLLHGVSGSALDARDRYRKAWTFLNQDYDGESTTLAIMDKAVRIASGYERSK